jgi:DNA-binding transcriptional regulator YiaG
MEKHELSYQCAGRAGGLSSYEGPNSVCWAEALMFLAKAYDMKTSKRYAESQLRVRPLTSAQIRAARSLIRWTADKLAAASALSVATIRRAELKESETALTAANDLAIRRALEVAGVEFIDENGGGPGVRLANRGSKKS